MHHRSERNVEERARPAGQREKGGAGSPIHESIGNTPLLRLTRISKDLPPSVSVCAKAEWMNPGGSVKDRPALSMILDGEKRGALTPGKTILDASSGNTAVAYAMIGAARGFRVTLCVPGNADETVVRTIRAYGAELIITNPRDGMDGATRAAREMYEESPKTFFFPDQLNNPANWRAHYDGTAPEIWQQSRGQVTHFVAGLGTAGTFVGTGRRLKELNNAVRLVAVQPAAPIHGLEGLRHITSSIVPGIYDPALADETMAVETDEAQQMARRLAREEGIFVGVSAGAAVVAALRAARSLSSGVVVAILPDGGRRYLNAGFWEAP